MADYNPEDTTTAHEVMLGAHLLRAGVKFERQWEFEGRNGYHGYADFFLPLSDRVQPGGLRGFAIEVDGHPVNLEREAALWSVGVVPVHLRNQQLHTEADAAATLRDLVRLIATITEQAVRAHEAAHAAGVEAGRALNPLTDDDRRRAQLASMRKRLGLAPSTVDVRSSAAGERE